jgi:hypothetical protein
MDGELPNRLGAGDLPAEHSFIEDQLDDQVLTLRPSIKH